MSPVALRDRIVAEVRQWVARFLGAIIAVEVGQWYRPGLPFWLAIICGALGAEAGYRVWRYWPWRDDAHD